MECEAMLDLPNEPVADDLACGCGVGHLLGPFSVAGAVTMLHGFAATTSRLIAHLTIIGTAASVRVAWMGAPRSTMPSSSAITSRRVMPFALRQPQAGGTSLFMMRASSAPLRFLLACLSR